MIEYFIRAVVAGTPLLIAALGEIVTERSGILNLGIEGIFVLGAATAFTMTITTGSPILGLIGGVIVGAIIGLIHSIVTITFRGNQVVSGLALTILGYGLASLIGKGYVGTPITNVIRSYDIWYAILIVILAASTFLWYLMFKTKIGAILRASGENPHAAEALGVNVLKVRYLATIFGASLCGLAGAWHVVGYINLWTEGTGVGRGWIALAIVIVSGWNTLLAPLIAFLFGGIEATMWILQLPPYNVDPYLLGMIPYIVTLIALIVFMATPLKRRFKPPDHLGKPYFKEERTI